MSIFSVLLMFYLHILDDFHIQGILTNMKQKSWWDEQTQDPMYSQDYIVALLVHAFSWAFFIMLPIAYHLNFQINILYLTALFVNTILHAVIDDLKANKHRINLIQDQLFHAFQIILTAAFFMI